MTLLAWVGIVAGGAILSGSTVAISIHVANRIGMHDHPDGGRKVQESPVPKLGGLAIALSFSIATVAALLFSKHSVPISLAAAFLLPALLAAVLGYVDDLRNIRPNLRLSLQAGIGLVAWVVGIRVQVTGESWLDFLLTALWFMVLVNGINLLDNSDGLAASTVLTASLGSTVIAFVLGQELISLLGLALVGVCIGYLWHNWYPARVYMGDSGSYFLGAMLATMIIGLKSPGISPWLTVAVAVLLAALPIADTLYVVYKRLRSGIHPFTAGRDHLSHDLQNQGKSVPASILLLQAGSVLGATLAVGLTLIQLI